MKIAVIIATYNWPWALERVLWGYATQTNRRFQVVVADDGSGPATAELIAQMRDRTGLAITHVWHEDRGFRKNEILNRAILATQADYLIFTDGDVVPRDDFVAEHLRHCRPDRYLAGMTVRLPRVISDALTPEDIRSGRATDLRWLWARGLRPGRHVLRFSRNRIWNTVMDRITSTQPHWRGGNSSAWRSDIIAVNGYEMTMGYGGGDAELGTRLASYGIEPYRIRFRAMTVHLEHERPWRDADEVTRNRALRRVIQKSRRTSAQQGLAEVDVTRTRITSPPGD